MCALHGRENIIPWEQTASESPEWSILWEKKKTLEKKPNTVKRIIQVENCAHANQGKYKMQINSL